MNRRNDYFKAFLIFFNKDVILEYYAWKQWFTCFRETKRDDIELIHSKLLPANQLFNNIIVCREYLLLEFFDFVDKLFM